MLYPEGENDGTGDQEFCDHFARGYGSLSVLSGLDDHQPIEPFSLQIDGGGGGEGTPARLICGS
jgi:hypothetical protein